MNGTQEYEQAERENADRWVPACGGTEVLFQYNGTRYLYVFNFKRKQHGYLNMDTDIVVKRFDNEMG